MFISESWQLKLKDESVFPVHIRSQFKLQPYGAGPHMPVTSHGTYAIIVDGRQMAGSAYLNWKEKRERRNNRGLDVDCPNPFMSYMVQWCFKSNAKPSLTPGYNVLQTSRTPSRSHFLQFLECASSHPPAELFPAELLCSGTAISLSFL